MAFCRNLTRVILIIAIAFIGTNIYLNKTYELPASHTKLEDYLPPEIVHKEELITTKDGYILSVFVLHHRTLSNPSLPPVYFQHGYCGSGLSIILSGKKSGVYTLCEKGHTVYVVNGRGTPLSLRHTRLTFRDKSFWDFSFEDLGYDLVATADFIWARHSRKLVYLGHSQGGTQMLTAMVDDRFRADLERRVEKNYIFAPVVCTRHGEAVLLKVINKIQGLGPFIRETLGFVNYGKYRLPDHPIDYFLEKALNTVCSFDKRLCFFAFGDTDKDNQLNDLDDFGTWNRYNPASAPIKGALHFSQNDLNSQVENCVVRRFDYLSDEKNIEKYQSEVPPAYDFTKIAIPTKVYFGTQDKYFSVQDAEDFKKIMKGNKYYEQEIMEGWAHMTFSNGITNNEFYTALHNDIVKVSK